MNCPLLSLDVWDDFSAPHQKLNTNFLRVTLTTLPFSFNLKILHIEVSYLTFSNSRVGQSNSQILHF